VAPDIHAVALVAHGPGDAADHLAGLDENGPCATLPLELDGSGKPSGSGSYDDCGPTVHLTFPLPEIESDKDPLSRSFIVKGTAFAQ
jgi:hypothetical protein